MSTSSPDLERLAGIRTIDLTTYGRLTGRPRSIEIWWFRHEGRFIITGTPGRRDWLANVIADPRVVVHVDGQELKGTAVPVEDMDYRGRFFRSAQVSWYSTQAQLDHLIESAPMIEIQFQSSPPNV